MMKITLALLTLWSSSALAAVACVKQNQFETFEHSNPNETCGAVPSCPDQVPGPINGLTFNNVQVVFVHNPRPAGMQAADGIFYGGFIDQTKPIVISDKYNKSCVQSWKLNSFGAGCGSQQNIYDPYSNQTYNLPLGANCSVSLVGKDKNGKIVGKEKFRYNPGGVVLNNYGFPYWYMTTFNTTKGGLKDKEIQTLEITATNIPGNNPNDTYTGGFKAAIDALHYTLTNSTKCPK